MTEERKYTLAEIKAAFWAEFHGRGDVLFLSAHSGEEDSQECTEIRWESFVDELDAKAAELATTAMGLLTQAREGK